jgi:hypothetical protein
MAAMKSLPPPLHLSPRRSRRTLALLAVAYGATAALLMTLPLPVGIRVFGAAVVGACCAFAMRPLAGRRVPTLVRVALDGRIAVTACEGRTREGTLLADSCVGARVTTIVWRPDDARCARSLVVLSDTFAADDFRRLRVALRYGRARGDAAPDSSDAEAG